MNFPLFIWLRELSIETAIEFSDDLTDLSCGDIAADATMGPCAEL